MSNLTPEQSARVNKLAQLLKAKHAPAAPATQQIIANPIPTAAALAVQSIGMDGSVIELNPKQQAIVDLALKGASCILIGAAGTGKTTSMRAVMNALIQSGIAGILSNQGHNYLPNGTPGIVACAFTRRATNNLRRAMPPGMEQNCVTIHKLLEYAPEYTEVIDPITGDTKSVMRFAPRRNAANPLPSSIKCVVFEESSMISVDLFKQVEAACPHRPQFIFLGDIQQLPPVMGTAILGYKMLELPLVELTDVYRQALKSPIIRLAHRILSGKPIHPQEIEQWREETEDGKLTLHPWKKKLSADLGLATAAKFFTNAITHTMYDPAEDCILMPFNKSFGTEELNKHIANHLAKLAGAEVHEIIGGRNKVYLHEGVKVLYEKEDMIVTGIVRNPKYVGKSPQHASKHLDYWGFLNATGASEQHHLSGSDEELAAAEAMLEFLSSDAGEETSRAASHIISLKRQDSDYEVVLETSGDLNGLLLGYAITIHKSQGSEWRKVFIVLHQSHATMVQRELLYTGVTRAKQELYVICEPDSFVKGIMSQRIKGNTIAEKAEYFKGKLDLNGGRY